MDACVFCSIIARKLPSVVIAESESVLVIQDRVPKAPIHYLVIPKAHLHDVRDIPENDHHTWSNMLHMIQEVIRERLHGGDCKLVINNGKEAGQRVFHLHIHLLAGGIHPDCELA